MLTRSSTFLRASALLVVIGLTCACGTKPPSLGENPLGGPVNTGGKPDPNKTNADNVGPGGKVNTGGAPDPGKTNADTPVGGGKPNTGGAPDTSKSVPPSMKKDGGAK